jgi:hypothetical protein
MSGVKELRSRLPKTVSRGTYQSTFSIKAYSKCVLLMSENNCTNIERFETVGLPDSKDEDIKTVRNVGKG